MEQFTEVQCPRVKAVKKMTGHLITDKGVSNEAVFMFLADVPCEGGEHVHSNEMLLATFDRDALVDLYELIENVLARE